MNDTDITLGFQYRDSVTGFEGTATGVFLYLSSSARIMLERLDGGSVKSETFYVERLVEVEA